MSALGLRNLDRLDRERSEVRGKRIHRLPDRDRLPDVFLGSIFLVQPRVVTALPYRLAAVCDCLYVQCNRRIFDVLFGRWTVIEGKFLSGSIVLFVRDWPIRILTEGG